MKKHINVSISFEDEQWAAQIKAAMTEFTPWLVGNESVNDVIRLRFRNMVRGCIKRTVVSRSTTATGTHDHILFSFLLDDFRRLLASATNKGLLGVGHKGVAERKLSTWAQVVSVERKWGQTGVILEVWPVREKIALSLPWSSDPDWPKEGDEVEIVISPLNERANNREL